ncbi:MAG TPA: L,D-transpeptidase [Gillisia sp.]|nr:L,D-transpeptidase [Gillisia sp.]
MKGNLYKIWCWSALTLVGSLLFSCEEGFMQESSRERQFLEVDIPIKDTAWFEEPVLSKPPLRVTYKLDSLADMKKADSLWGSFSKEQQRILLALNRIESVRVGPGSKLVMPDTLLVNFNVYAPFPWELEILMPIPKTLLISRRVQAFALYECGRLIRWGPVSTGKQSTPTPAGLNYANYKAKRKVSTVNESWIMPYYFNYMNFEGVGVHQYLLPGFPASHACVRLDMADAMFIYDWAEQWKLDPKGITVIKNGTPFMVFGEYDFEGEVPWLQLIEDPTANDLNEEELKIIENYVREYFRDERNFRETKIIEPADFITT